MLFPSASVSPVSIIPATLHTHPQISSKLNPTVTTQTHIYTSHISLKFHLNSSVISGKEYKARSSWLCNFVHPPVTLIFSPSCSAQTQFLNLSSFEKRNITSFKITSKYKWNYKRNNRRPFHGSGCQSRVSCCTSKGSLRSQTMCELWCLKQQRDRQTFLRVPWFSPVCIIPPLHHTHSSITGTLRICLSVK
jgi:hypothetical protein